MKVRTRYAPSPTGFFHVGGARTALYNYLFAKNHGGDFIVRIEDTDSERNVENGVESQLDNIAWMGITPDESPLNEGKYGPYKQTQKLGRYETLAMSLIESNKAFYCFCSKEQLDEDRAIAEANHLTPKYNRRCLKLSQEEIQENLKNNIPHTIRLKIDEKADYKWNDIVRGLISVPGSALTDPVILKSNKIAMYNFAVVVDDYDMDITHILRGEEHISNTPYQIAIKTALGFNDKEINYGHLSIIVNAAGKKLSKRDLTLKQFISDYNELGYLPIAIDNFLALLGWVPTDNKEIMSLEEMVKKFDIKNVGKSPAKFEISKMDWVGNQHFKLLSEEEYLAFVTPFVTSTNEIYLKHKKDVLTLFKSQLSYSAQLNELIEDLFGNSEIDEECKSEIKNSVVNFTTLLPIITDVMKSTEFASEEDYKSMINLLKEKSGLKGKDLFMPIRILCTKKMHGPELAKTLYLFGKDKVIENIKLIESIISKECKVN
ncbi:MAG: glutamate--tRNA ligase [Mycoplasma sp.]